MVIIAVKVAITLFLVALITLLIGLFDDDLIAKMLRATIVEGVLFFLVLIIIIWMLI